MKTGKKPPEMFILRNFQPVVPALELHGEVVAAKTFRIAIIVKRRLL